MKLWKDLAVVAVAALFVCCAVAGEEETVPVAPPTDEAQVVPVAPPTDEAAEKAIAEANRRLLDAFLARDLEGWLAGFTEDAILMPPGVMMIVGLDALRESSWIQFGELEKYEVEIEAEPDEIVVAGSWAYSRTSFEGRYQPLDGGEPIVDRGRSLAIWERQPDGGWLISRYIANRPLPGPG